MFKSEIVCKSELIEPAMAHIIEVHLNRISELKSMSETEIIGEFGSSYNGVKEDRILKECSDLWFAMETLRSLSVAAKGAIHFSMAIGNEYIKIAEYIKHLTGIDPTNTYDYMFNFKR